MDNYQTEIIKLLRRVEQKYAKPLKTRNDFNIFSLFLKYRCGDLISPSTLKRLWGYVTYPHHPRMQTLDSLSHFLGYADFQAFCNGRPTGGFECSAFFSTPSISSDELDVGAEVELGWAPNRYVCLAYCGNFIYEVTEVLQSKLRIGDRFEVSGFVLGQPLTIPYILRDGFRTGAFVAGRNGGLTLLNTHSHGQV